MAYRTIPHLAQIVVHSVDAVDAASFARAWNCGRAQHLNDDPLPPLAIELGIEDALPGSQVEFPVGDRRRDF